MEELERIRAAATRFRFGLDALETADYPPYWFGSFPRGTCGDVTLMLGQYFVDIGILGFTYMGGERGIHELKTWTSHAWLVRDGLCVDITADQFTDAPAAVIVESPSPWHTTFRWGSPSIATFTAYNPPQWQLSRTYGRVKLALELSAAVPRFEKRT